MKQASETHSRVEHPGERQALLETLTQPGGASLLFEGPGNEPLPALLMEARQGEHLLVDITAVAEIAAAMEQKTVYLVGQASGAMLRTPPLKLIDWVDRSDRVQCLCEYPEYVDVMHRRGAFRAELRPGMDVRVTLLMAHAEGPVSGALKNLSLGGCLLELPLAAAMGLHPEQAVQSLALHFPNGQWLEVPAMLRHVQGDSEHQLARVGCEFSAVDTQIERRLWFYVREIERESARNAMAGERALSPSSLFEPREGVPAASSRPHGADYATPMARRLARVTAYLDSQLLALQDGEPVAARDLSRYSDQVLGLLEEDREAVLFAAVCMIDDHPLVQHGLAVAVRLADLAAYQGLPRDTRKAIVASALVHDMGKALLPAELRRAPHLNAEQRSRFAAHVALIEERLGDCRWLSEAVRTSVVAAVNERLDGGGYPHGLSGERLDTLARMAAIVDVVDAMGRDRADRQALTASHIYRHLLHHGEQFDLTWVQRYVRHFGVAPIGSLARYANGELAWIQRLDRQGKPRQVQLTPVACLPGNELGEVLRDDDLARLGKLEALVVPSVRARGLPA
ncbi:HD domain-containing phosphohydrolase [Litchfieldella rifensis]|uniref:HD domain-containing phosphohydrolase n=1 Tax=Litchfieldella rifensis TaxID=762643 RepID=A0ABV7LNB0_9GAMM